MWSVKNFTTTDHRLYDVACSGQSDTTLKEKGKAKWLHIH
jgi:hypothetical protein